MKTITPILNGKRVKVKVSEADYDKVTRGLGYKGIITNQKTGKTFRLYGRACSLPNCYCDAEIRPTLRAVDLLDSSAKSAVVAQPANH